MFSSLVNGFKKSIRAPILYGLREIPLYRRITGLPTNKVIGLEFYLNDIRRTNGHHPHKQTLVAVHPSAIVPIKPAGNREGVPTLISSITEFATPATFVARLAGNRVASG